MVDHDTRRLVWAAPGRDTATLRRFFDELGDERCQLITHVSADAADWIAAVVRTRCMNARLVLDPLCETSRNGSYVQLRIMWPGGPRSVGTGRSSRVRIRIIQRHSPVRNASSGSAGL